MTKREAMRQTHQENALMSLGFTMHEADQLRRISLVLHRWAEHECNGDIERDEATDIPYRSFAAHGGKHHAYRIPDREAGAIKRLKAIIARVNLHERHGAMPDGSGADRTGAIAYYIQGDPRGCALYILRPGDVPDGKDVNGYYSRGLAVY